ncbi:MAG: hypothetical protein U0746_08515 [Gemmataceae bacterium]
MYTNRQFGLAATARLVLGVGLVLLAFCGTAFAQPSPDVPEIDASTAMSGLTLLSGGLLIATNRLRRK